jgi:hypothetical protein
VSEVAAVFGSAEVSRNVVLISAQRNELTDLTISPQRPASILKPIPAIFHHRLSIIKEKSLHLVGL